MKCFIVLRKGDIVIYATSAKHTSFLHTSKSCYRRKICQKLDKVRVITWPMAKYSQIIEKQNT